MQHGNEGSLIDDRASYTVFFVGLTLVWVLANWISAPMQFPGVGPVVIVAGTSAACGILALALFVQFDRLLGAITVGVAGMFVGNLVLFGVESDAVWRFGTLFFVWPFWCGLLLLDFTRR